MNEIHIKWILITIIIAIIGIFSLQIAGRFFIESIVQEVIIEAPLSGAVAAVGERAPYWELSDVTGRRATISDFAGTVVVLTFWTTWNALAADQITVFDSFLSSYRDPQFVIITINNQEEQAVVSQFLKRGSYQVTTFLDESGAVGEQYALRNLPATYFIDKDGIVQDVFVGSLNEEQLLEKVRAIIR
jgi:peroxiredoxin